MVARPEGGSRTAGHGRQPGAQRRAGPVHDPSGRGTGRAGACVGGDEAKRHVGATRVPQGLTSRPWGESVREGRAGRVRAAGEATPAGKRTGQRPQRDAESLRLSDQGWLRGAGFPGAPRPAWAEGRGGDKPKDDTRGRLGCLRALLLLPPSAGRAGHGVAQDRHGAATCTRRAWLWSNVHVPVNTGKLALAHAPGGWAPALGWVGRWRWAGEEPGSRRKGPPVPGAWCTRGRPRWEGHGASVSGEASYTFVKIHLQPQSGDGKRPWPLGRGWHQAGRQPAELGVMLNSGLEVGGQAQPTGQAHGGRAGGKLTLRPRPPSGHAGNGPTVAPGAGGAGGPSERSRP